MRLLLVAAALAHAAGAWGFARLLGDAATPVPGIGVAWMLGLAVATLVIAARWGRPGRPGGATLTQAVGVVSVAGAVLRVGWFVLRHLYGDVTGFDFTARDTAWWLTQGGWVLLSLAAGVLLLVRATQRYVDPDAEPTT